MTRTHAGTAASIPLDERAPPPELDAQTTNVRDAAERVACSQDPMERGGRLGPTQSQDRNNDEDETAYIVHRDRGPGLCPARVPLLHRRFLHCLRGLPQQSAAAHPAPKSDSISRPRPSPRATHPAVSPQQQSRSVDQSPSEKYFTEALITGASQELRTLRGGRAPSIGTCSCHTF